MGFFVPYLLSSAGQTSVVRLRCGGHSSQPCECRPRCRLEVRVQDDWANADRFSTGAAFHVMDDCPEVAHSFARLYNACQVSRCITILPVEDAIFDNAAPVAFAAAELLGWPKFQDNDPNGNV
jgi:hypothetical protein